MKKIFVALLITASLATGCDKGPKTVPAKGVLTQKNAPLAGANIVVVYPDGNSATGASDKDGKFSLTYLGRNGALPGTDLKVGVTKAMTTLGAIDVVPMTGTGGPPKTDEEAMANAKMMMEVMQKRAEAQQKQMKQGGGDKHLLDTKFSNPDSSGLKLTIPANGSEELKIDVP